MRAGWFAEKFEVGQKFAVTIPSWQVGPPSGHGQALVVVTITAVNNRGNYQRVKLLEYPLLRRMKLIEDDGDPRGIRASQVRRVLKRLGAELVES